jgi:hypothetical protein
LSIPSALLFSTEVPPSLRQHPTQPNRRSRQRNRRVLALCRLPNRPLRQIQPDDPGIAQHGQVVHSPIVQVVDGVQSHGERVEILDGVDVRQQAGRRWAARAGKHTQRGAGWIGIAPDGVAYTGDAGLSFTVRFTEDGGV